MKSVFNKLALVLAVMLIALYTSPCLIFAASLDDLSSESQDKSSSSSNASSESSSDARGDSISDYLKGYEAVSEENMASANQLAGPVATALGTISGFIIIVVSAAIFTITALDLAYIGVPPIRSFLNPGSQQGTQGGMGMGGMGMGMRGGYGGMGGMGMMGGGAQPQSAHTRVWVSDEAIAAVMSAQQANQTQQNAGGGMGMGGMGMGMGMGGMGMGGGTQPAKVPFKSTALEYLKHRSFFLVVFTVCTIILMSSVFTDCGINLAALLSKVISKFNGSINNVG